MIEVIRDCPWDHFGTHSQKVVVNRWWTNVVCSCGAKGPGHHSKEAAIETWNTRDSGTLHGSDINDNEIEAAFEELENIINDEYVRDKVSVLKNAVCASLAEQKARSEKYKLEE